MAAIAPSTDHLVPVLIEPVEHRFISVEWVIFALIGVLSAIGHLYALDVRALHHDETLHAAFSWDIYRGNGYLHDPLLHGPFLYYITAFGYLLFGDSDFTARLTAVLFGIAATLLPALLRRELGRSAVLLACGYLLVSPVFLYVGRFLRHDIYAVTWELLSVVALVRYIQSERPVWHYTLAASMGLMLTTMETFYLFSLVMVSFVGLWLVWQVAQRLVWLCAGYGVALAAALVGGRALAGPIPLPTSAQALDVRHQPNNDLGAYMGKAGDVLWPMLRHPSIWLGLLLSIAFVGTLVYLIFVRRDSEGQSAWRRAVDAAPSGTLAGALDRIPRRQWLVAFAIAFAIYTVQYTALLSNPNAPNTAGLVTGVSGSLLYWLGQHGVQRGGQPPHYYLFQLSVYEPLLLLFAPLGIGMVAKKLWHVRHWSTPAVRPSTMALQRQQMFVPALLAWWSIGAVLIYSWAGEKMPWLTIHIVVPLALLSAWAFVQIWQWVTAQRHKRRMLALTVLTTLTASLLVVIGLRITTLARVPQSDEPIALWLGLALLLVVLLPVGVGFNYRSFRPAIHALLLLVCIFGTLLTIRSSMRASFINGDVPVEPLVYVQTSPDVHRVMADLERVSLLNTGGPDLPIQYDNETIWDWYLRNYTQSEGSGTEQLTISEETQAVLLLTENVSAHQDQLDGFVQQSYPLRWWFPECGVYRLANDAQCSSQQTPSLLTRLLVNPLDNATLADSWNFWINRRVPAPLEAVDWSLFVRPALAAEFDIGAGASNEYP